MRRLALSVGLVGLFLIAIALTAGLSPTLPLMVDPLEITVSYHHALDTRVRLVLGTAPPLTEINATMTAAVPTRTAIALARNLRSAGAPTPHPLRVTADQIFAATATVYARPPGYFVPTPLPCVPIYQTEIGGSDLGQQITAALAQDGMDFAFVRLDLERVGQPESCGVTPELLHTQVMVIVEVRDIHLLTDRLLLSELAASLLAHLPSALPSDQFGVEPPGLVMFFQRGGAEARMIATDYASALAAYEEGLRGEALLEALGGVLPLYSR